MSVQHVKARSGTASAAYGSAAQLILKAAYELFYSDGICAVTVDAIKTKAGVTKTTFYNAYPSKTQLVTAYLETQDRKSRRRLTDAAIKDTIDPGEPLVRIFDVLDLWFNRPDFGGCPFTNALGERGQFRLEILRHAKRHKFEIMEWFETQAREASARNPTELAQALMLLYDGAIVAASTRRDLGTARVAKTVALGLLRDQGISVSGRDSYRDSPKEDHS